VTSQRSARELPTEPASAYALDPAAAAHDRETSPAWSHCRAGAGKPAVRIAAAIEELLYRVLLLSGLAVVLSPVRGGRWIAVLLSAALFGAAHLGNPGASWVAAVGTGLGGVMYGVAFLGTRSVWLPIGLHLGWNLAQGVFGFPISGHVVPGIFRAVPTAEDVLVLTGGPYGPEAGIPGMLARFVVIGLVVLYLGRRWPDGGFATLTYAPEPQRRSRAA